VERVVYSGWGAGHGVWGGEASAADLWIGSGGGVGVCQVKAGGGKVKQISWIAVRVDQSLSSKMHALSPGSSRSN